MKESFYTYQPDLSTRLSLPYFANGIKAGYPSPAKDYRVHPIDLNISLTINAENDYYAKIQDNDLAGFNIFEGDFAIIKGTNEVYPDMILHCIVDGYDIIRKLKIDNRYNKPVRLITSDERIRHIEVTAESDCLYKGVVYYTITPHVPVLSYTTGKDKNSVDLNKLLVKRPSSTFYALVDGNSMKDANILDGDLVVIDRSMPYLSGYKAVCRIGEDFTIKIIEKGKNGKIWLMPANDEFEPIKLTNDKYAEIWGIVRHSLTSHVIPFKNLFYDWTY